MPTSSPEAVRSMVGAAFSFSLMALFAKLAGPEIPSPEIVCIRSAITLLLTWHLLRRVRLDSWRGRHQGLLLLRGSFGFGALCLFFYSVTHLPLAEATVIQFTNPIFTALIASVYLGERSTARIWAALALGLGGVLLITRPAVLFGGQASSLPPAIVLVGLAGAVLTSCAHVMVRRLTADEHELLIILYFPLVAVPAGLALSAPVWVWPDGRQWLILLAVGLTAQVGQICLTRGMKHLAAAGASVILYLQIFFATVWSVTVLGEPLEPWTVAGSLLILAGTLVAARRPRPPA